MNGKRAKLLRKMAQYDMKEERKAGREYNIVFLTRYAQKKGHVTYLCKGPRALYKMWKAAAKRRKHDSS